MFGNYLKVALRNLLRHKGYSFINVVGLAIGMAICILILLWVKDELSYDRFYAHVDQLYRVTYSWQSEEYSAQSALTPDPLPATLAAEIPEILHATRFNIEGEQFIKHDGKSYYNDIMAIADPDFLAMFSVPLVQGDPDEVLAGRFSVVISESMSRKYFGEGPVLGQVLNIDRRDFTVAGIMPDRPHNSHMRFDCLAPFDSRPDWLRGLTEEKWNVSAYYSYVQLSGPTSVDEALAKIASVVDEHKLEAEGNLIPGLQPITDIHLYHDFEDYLEGHGSITYVVLFSILAMLILGVACINYMNITTARGSARAREIEIRKIVGASRIGIVRQIMIEGIIHVLAALVLTFAIIELSLPAFSAWTGKDLVLGLFGDFYAFAGAAGIILIAWLLSGVYPALLFSRYGSTNIMQTSARRKRGEVFFGRTLVIIQLVVSIGLIICLTAINRQLSYAKQKKIGFAREHLLYLDMRGDFQKHYAAIKENLMQNPAIAGVTAGRPPVSGFTSAFDIRVNGRELPAKIRMSRAPVDFDYLTTLGMEIKEGHGFSPDGPGGGNTFILNETAVNVLGLANPLDAEISFSGHGQDLGVIEFSGTIAGVVEDFHYGPLHNSIKPVIMYYSSDELYDICVRVQPDKTTEAIAAVQSEWNKYAAAYPFDFHFVDETIDNFYAAERQLEGVFRLFAGLAMLISCLGLFGLVSYMANRRTKEIGIRKVLGASVFGITGLLAKEFAILVAAANVIAWPLAYYAANRWLENFAYREGIGLSTFVLAGGIVLIITLCTVSFHTVKAALVNPIDSLRHE